MVDKLKYLRNRSLRFANCFHRQACYARRAPLIEVADEQEFFSYWQIAEKIKEDIFFVRNLSFVWNGKEDILLAQVWTGPGAEKRIRTKDTVSFRKNIHEQRPLLIFKIGKAEKFIVLSHSSRKTPGILQQMRIAAN